MSRRRLFTLVPGGLLSGLVAARALAQDEGRKKYRFRGKVEKVDPKAKTVTVANENIPGWMMAMTMTYAVDKAATLEHLKAGDQITATVYQHDFKTLYDVEVMPAEGEAAPQAAR